MNPFQDLIPNGSPPPPVMALKGGPFDDLIPPPAQQNTPQENPMLTKAKDAVYSDPGTAEMAYGANAMQAVPIVGPFLDEVGSAGAAALGYGKGDNFGDRYGSLQQSQKTLREAGQAEQPAQTAMGQVGTALASLKGVPALPRFNNVLARLLAGTAAGGAYGAEYGFGSGSGLEDRIQKAKNLAGPGAVLGLATSSGGELLDAAAQGARKYLPAAKASLIDKAEQLGIPIYKSQVSESRPLKIFSSVMKDLPFSGAEGRALAQQEGIGQAIAGTMGEDASAITPDVMAAAKDRLGQGFESVNSANNLTMNKNVIDQLQSIKDEANRYLPEGDVKPINSILEDILSRTKNATSGAPSTGAGIIDGKTYQAFRTKLNDMNSGGIQGNYLKQIRGAIDDAFSSGLSGDAADQLNTLRDQYKNMKIIQGVAAVNPEGNLPPAALAAAVRRANPNFAYGGGGDLGDIARIGQMVKDSVPNSGTAQRSMMIKLLAGAGGLGTAMALGKTGEGIDPGRTALAALAGGLALRPINNVVNAPVTPQWMNSNPSLSQLAEILRTLPAQPRAYGNGQ